MKTIAAVSLAVMIAAGSATSASAFVPTGLLDHEDYVAESEATFDEHPIDRCHGRSAGTSHRHCGSLTGGPAGGLF